ncbi:hypothetical protein Pen02_03960 [Plantactinospora endophytica]|uniref:Uncharacterized protein n=1 Tax=Plantactinospora endophytica TaxID=673535 RepID=A0ABQ4DSP9_9ACTN|nr:hypothetical protein Pen02_03960 [Plantactinospora endophytica]
MRGDRAGCVADPEQSHRPGGRVHQDRDVVRVEYDHSDPERVKTFTAESGQPAGLLVSGYRRPPVTTYPAPSGRGTAGREPSGDPVAERTGG